ncbi:MAG: patatin-like phospholipase family protein [Akkermansiaceae bacterium]|nr:patatin-like phospholipase family protein [Akkermansiaceae bacterium]
MFEKFFTLFRRKPKRERTKRPLRQAQPLKLGLALSSGGARGLAHVGVLQVLEENGIEVHAIAGSSMGSYVGSLWAAGFSGKDLVELSEEMHDKRQLWKLADPILPPMKGLFYGLKAKAHLMRSIGDLHFEDLERQLLVIAVDIDTKERLILCKGSIADAVHASCAMPGIIAPVMVNGHRCVDGGVIDPVPVGALRRFSDVDRVIAVSVIPTFDEIYSQQCDACSDTPISLWQRMLEGVNRQVNVMAPGNVIDTFRKSISAAQIRLAHDAVQHADLCLRPEHFSAKWNDYANFERFINAGRKAAEDKLDIIRALLDPNQAHDPKKNHMVGDRLA